jgi:uncharacterized surface protein with fasciclin (FAS1) repeats
MKINNQLSSVLFVALLGATVNFSSCTTDNDTPAPVKTNTITDVVVGNASFSILKEAVVKAKLDGTLSSAGPFTVFAPDNAAFALASINAAFVTATSDTALKNLLLYHTLPGKTLAAGVPAGPNAKVTTAGGDSVFLTKNANGVFVNGIKVAVADIPADNGVIHQLSVALNKPKGTIVETALASLGGDNGLDSLVVAVTTAGLGTTLSGSVYTVFAPTNKAFRELLTALALPNVKSITLSTLIDVLKYHVTAASAPSGPRVFSSDLPNGALPMLLSGKSTTTNVAASGATIKGSNGVLTLSVGGSTDNTCTIIAANIMCRNGVVHVIDRVLLP